MKSIFRSLGALLILLAFALPLRAKSECGDTHRPQQELRERHAQESQADDDRRVIHRALDLRRQDL